MQTKRTIFRSRGLPYLLLAPQLAITIIFFLWPAGQAVWQSFLREDAFGLKTSFVGLANYTRLFHSPDYLNAMQVTLVFAVSTAALAMILSLLLAVAVDRLIRASRWYTTLLVWPYAVAPAVAG
ncbi:MAG: glycerol-3-phosphate transporter permease, partial [Pseudooceanicola nanhaiensis]